MSANTNAIGRWAVCLTIKYVLLAYNRAPTKERKLFLVMSLINQYGAKNPNSAIGMKNVSLVAIS